MTAVLQIVLQTINQEGKFVEKEQKDYTFSLKSFHGFKSAKFIPAIGEFFVWGGNRASRNSPDQTFTVFSESGEKFGESLCR